MVTRSTPCRPRACRRRRLSSVAAPAEVDRRPLPCGDGALVDVAQRRDILDRWRQPGDEAKYPKLTLNPATYGLDSEWNYNTTQWLYSGNYARLKNITIGYNVPMPKTSKTRIRFSVIATNLLTMTKYPGLDPEIARDFEDPQDRNMSPNVTYLSAPQQRAYSGSINVSF